MHILETVFVYRLARGAQLAWHGRYHAHGANEYEIHFFIEGEGYFLSNTAKRPISDNTLFLCGPKEFHSIIPRNGAKPVTYYAVLFRTSETDDAELPLLLNAFLKRKTAPHVPQTSRFLFEELLRLSASKRDHLKKSAVHLLTSLIYRWHSDSIPTAQTTEADCSRFKRAAVQNALDYFSAHLGDRITVGDTAYRQGFSAEHFIRIFREEMHLTPYQYLIRLRIEAAAAELITTRKSVASIAESYAFENQFHFSRIFKKCTGQTPTSYRNCYVQKN